MLSPSLNRGAYVSLSAVLLIRLISNLCGVESIEASYVLYPQQAGTIDKVVLFANYEDLINPSINVVHRKALAPGQAILFSCGASHIYKTGTIDMLPQYPLGYTLPYHRDSDGIDALTRPLPNYQIFRSDVRLIESYNDGTDNIVYQIKHPRDAVIMAKHPDNFILNYACKYQPKDITKPPIFKWLAVRFIGVYPMAYGCESSDKAMFINGIPQERESFAKKRERRLCYIEPKPRMIVGIYCKPGDKLNPPNCLQEHVLDKVLMPKKFNKKYLDSSFHYTEFPDRFRLVMLSPYYDGKTPLSCSCTDSNNVLTKRLIIQKKRKFEINVLELVRMNRVSLAKDVLPLSFSLEPGTKVKLLYNINKAITLRDGSEILGWLFPKDPRTHVGVTADDRELIEIPLNDFIGRRRFNVERTDTFDGTAYTFNYNEDAIVVLKKPANDAIYQWYMKANTTTALPKIGLLLSLTIVPTDPYTYGCGPESRDLFNNDGIEVKKVYSNGYMTTCKINPYVRSPVGFYCPRGLRLQPPDCFTHMIYEEKLQIVPLSRYAPLARTVNGKNINVVDFHLPDNMKDKITYPNIQLICRCRDDMGYDHAIITLDLRDPSTQ